jgi:hypothetical protein
MTGHVADLSWKSGARAIEKIRSTKVDAGDFKHELLNRLRSTMVVNVLSSMFYENILHSCDIILTWLCLFHVAYMSVHGRNPLHFRI